MNFRDSFEKGKERVKRHIKKKITRALIKAAAKLLKKLLIKLVLVIIKAIMAAVAALVAALGIPTVIVLAIVVILGGAMFFLAPVLGLIDEDSPVSQEELRTELTTLIENSSSEPQYRPPFELVSSIDMMRIIQEDKDPWEVEFEPIVTTLSPELTYETFQDSYETKTVKTETYEVTTVQVVTEEYESWEVVGTERKQVGTRQVLIGTKRVFVCSEEDAISKPPRWVEANCWEEEPVYDEIPVYEEVPVYGWVTRTREVEKPVTEERTRVTEDIKTSKKDVTKLKTAHSWNRFETFYYKEVELNTDFELVEVKENGDIKTEIYKRKSKEWVFDRKDFEYNYQKFDQVLNDLKLDDSAIKLLVESLKVNGIALDNYMGDFFGSFIQGGMTMMIPQEYMEIYKGAEEKYGVLWNYLAAIHYVETKFSTIEKMESHVGAIGHFQFMPCTFVGWSHPTCSGLGQGDIPADEMVDPAVIARHRGYGVDANSDGKADPWDLEDAAFSAANYLSSNGFTDNVKRAIWHYNHSDKYIADVMHYAELFKSSQGGVPPISDGTFTRPATGPITSSFGARWGAQHFGVDIGKRGEVVPIVAAADGVVSRSYTSSSYGECIMITHNIDGVVWETVYAHMVSESRRVEEGDMVQKGQIIGIMGNTGRSTGAHLHFELHRGGGWNNSKSFAIDPVSSGVIPW